jgi:hypothetical protein
LITVSKEETKFSTNVLNKSSFLFCSVYDLEIGVFSIVSNFSIIFALANKLVNFGVKLD